MTLTQLLQSHLPTWAVDVFRLAVWLVILSAVFVPLERAFARRPGPLLRPQWRTDLGYYFLNNLVPALLLSLPLAGLAWLARHTVPAGWVATVAALPLWAKLLLTLVVGEFGFYWGHRACHHWPLLWRFHAVHHSAEKLDFLVNTRAHPVDMVVTRLFGLVPLYLLGLAAPTASGSAMPLGLILLGTVWGFFIHANLRWRFGPLEALLATPAFHHWHHTRSDHIDRNFASMLPVFDRLFGTLYLPKHWPAEQGISEPMPPDLPGQLWAPFQPGRTPATSASPGAAP